MVAAGGSAGDRVAPLAFWLVSATITQVDAAALFIAEAHYGWMPTWPNRGCGSGILLGVITILTTCLLICLIHLLSLFAGVSFWGERSQPLRRELLG
jgi:hypothetical protein